MDDKVYSQLKNKWKSINEGLVKLPVSDITKWVDDNINDIIDKLKETYKNGYNTYIDNNISFVNPYTNEKDELTVNIQKKLFSDNENMDSLMHYDRKEHALYLSANTFLERLKTMPKIKEYIKKGIIHELTHVVDPGREYKKQQHGSYDEYINSDIEFPAFMRQNIEYIKSNPELIPKVLDALRYGKNIPNKDISTWYNKLTDKNKKKFVNELVKELA